MMDILERLDLAADLAREFDRLFPEQVDDTPRDWGHGTEAGHIGHQNGDGQPITVGWYCAAGNAGNPVLDIPIDQAAEALRLLRGMVPGVDLQDLVATLRAKGITVELHV